MPHTYDLNELEKIKTVIINPSGWINPLTIEYGFDKQFSATCYWRVKGTNHTFTIPVVRLDFLSEGNYGKHFSEVLEGFREDYLQWKSQGFFTTWMQEYQREYEWYIVT